MKRFLPLNIFCGLLFISSMLWAQNNPNVTCDAAIAVCPDNEFGQNIVSESGNGLTAESGPDYGCLGSEPNPLWYKMRVASTGTFMFDLTQYTGENGTGTAIDVDFAVWGPFATEEEMCGNLDTAHLVDSSYDATAYEVIDFYSGDGCGPEPTSNPQVLNEGDWYMILITNYNGNAGFINLIPDTNNTGSFDCSILGPTYYFCDNDGDGQETVNINDYASTIIDPSEGGVSFHPTYEDANNYTNLITGEQTMSLDSPLTVYARKETWPPNSTVEVIVISFEVIAQPELNNASLQFCDNDGNGLEIFDLTAAQTDIENGSQGLSFTYYTSEADANAETNAIADPTYYESGNATIYVRGAVDDCYAIAELELSLIDTMDLENVSVEVCDPGSGTYIINLTAYENQILNGNTGNIGYYENEADAIAGNANTIADPGVYTSSGGTVYAYVANGDCNAVATIDITINPLPVLVTPSDNYTFCDTGNDGTETVDLSFILADVYTGDTTGVTLQFYSTQNGAENAYPDDLVSSSDAYVLTGTVTLYVRVETAEGCSDYVPFTVELLPGIDVVDASLSLCDSDQDGQETFDLTQAESDILNGVSGVTLSYFETQASAISNTNAIADPTAFSGGNNIVYVRADSSDCFQVVELSLILLQPIGTQSITIEECDTDGDGQITVDLSSYEAQILNGNTATLYFYENQSDAEAGNNNYLTNTAAYTTSGITLYVYADNGSQCKAISTVTITIQGIPGLTTPTESYKICDAENNNSETINLNSVLGDIVPGNASDYTINYYLSETDAMNNNTANAISNPESYNLTATTTFYIYVENASGCASYTSFVFELNAGIDLYSDTLYTCDAGTGSGTYDLTTADVTTATASLSYHTTMADALAGTNPIASPEAYTATVPGTVYVHVATTQGCVTTTEINLEYSDPIVLNIPTEVPVCTGYPSEVDAGAGFAVYEWSTGEATQTIQVSDLGSYWVTVTDGNGCTATHTFTVISGNAPEITQVTEGPDYLEITATGGEEPYSYSTNGVIFQVSNVFNYLPPGEYNVYVRGADGCVSAPTEVAIFEYPTLFTPNGDGINDTWRLPGMRVYPNSQIRIFDRYGALVYEGINNGNEMWNGRDFSGKVVSTQDYWYIINVSDGREIHGHVTVKSRTKKGK